MRQVRRQVEPVSRPEVDRLRAGGDPQKTLDDPARFGKRVRVLGHPRAREIRPPRGDHAFALERAPQRGHLQRPEPRVPGTSRQHHDTNRGAPTRMRRAIKMIAPAYNRRIVPLGTRATKSSKNHASNITTVASNERFRAMAV